MRTVFQPPVIWDIHADESSQTDHRYIVIGALWGRADKSATVIKMIEDAIRVKLVFFDPLKRKEFTLHLREKHYFE